MSLRKFVGGGGGLVQRGLNLSLKTLRVSFVKKGRQFHFEWWILFIA